jgi:hypothetical protein
MAWEQDPRRFRGQTYWQDPVEYGRMFEEVAMVHFNQFFGGVLPFKEEEPRYIVPVISLLDWLKKEWALAMPYCTKAEAKPTRITHRADTYCGSIQDELFLECRFPSIIGDEFEWMNDLIQQRRKWKNVRKELGHVDVREAVDYLSRECQIQ